MRWRELDKESSPFIAFEGLNAHHVLGRRTDCKACEGRIASSVILNGAGTQL